MDGTQTKLADLERLRMPEELAEALPRASELVDELEEVRGDERLLARARCIEAASLCAVDRVDEGIAVLRRVVAAHACSSQPELRRVAIIAQNNIVNHLMCNGDLAGSDQAMDEFVGQFGEAGADLLQEEAVLRTKQLGEPLDAFGAGAVALGTARILARCAPQRVASVTAAAIEDLRVAPATPGRDVLIAQLERLAADASGD
jgi:hypothetical protein